MPLKNIIYILCKHVYCSVLLHILCIVFIIYSYIVTLKQKMSEKNHEVTHQSRKCQIYFN